MRECSDDVMALPLLVDLNEAELSAAVGHEVEWITNPPIEEIVGVADRPELPDSERHSEDVSDSESSSTDVDSDAELDHSNTMRKNGFERMAPTEIQAARAVLELDPLIRPLRGPKSKGYKVTKLTGWLRQQVEEMRTFLHLYTSPSSSVHGKWTVASVQACLAHGKKKGHSRILRQRTIHFIQKNELPSSRYGKWSRSKLKDEAFAQELQLHLQGIGKYVKADDIVEYLNRPSVREKYNITKSLSLATGKRWMKKMDFRWVLKHRGLYIDGHERSDVVHYRQHIFLPTWYRLAEKMRYWLKGEEEGCGIVGHVPQGNKVAVVWHHDESIFYAHDRREAGWVLSGASPEPYAKGEGVSLMVADFVSADYGFLKSRNGSESARVIFRPGKNRDGYFVNEDILKQAQKAMDILKRDYPNEEHIFIYDNAKTHLKRAEDALSARKMPKNIPKEGMNWGVEITTRHIDGTIIHDTSGKPMKTKIRMRHGMWNGQQQDLYFPVGHPRAGIFKGMAIILAERGYPGTYQLRAECAKFKCDLTATTPCCCRRLLYNEPDFADAKSLLEDLCEKQGFRTLFVPKFHPELNCIEQCWGRAKYLYRMNPPSSTLEDLEHNMLSALDSITLTEIRRCVNYLGFVS